MYAYHSIPPSERLRLDSKSHSDSRSKNQVMWCREWTPTWELFPRTPKWQIIQFDSWLGDWNNFKKGQSCPLVIKHGNGTPGGYPLQPVGLTWNHFRRQEALGSGSPFPLFETSLDTGNQHGGDVSSVCPFETSKHETTWNNLPNSEVLESHVAPFMIWVWADQIILEGSTVRAWQYPSK
jgi:hypothetical protein